MRIGDSVLATFRQALPTRGRGEKANFTDTRRQGMIDSHRYPLGFYWVVFVDPNGEVRQMNHESEIHGDPRTVATGVQTLFEVHKQAVLHFRAGGSVAWRNGVKVRDGKPPMDPADALAELAEIGQEEVIL